MPESDDSFPSPPFPHVDSDILRVIVQNTMDEYNQGEISVETAVLHAAVHAWYEGHLEGEDSCPGCQFRGSDGGLRGIDREDWVYRARRGQLRPDEHD